jgi:hypothetical protein
MKVVNRRRVDFTSGCSLELKIPPKKFRSENGLNINSFENNLTKYHKKTASSGELLIFNLNTMVSVIGTNFNNAT